MRYLIDPHNITDFNRSKRDLQTFWMFCVLVAGKNSAIQARKLNEFLSVARWNTLPFTFIEVLHDDGLLFNALEYHKLGQYRRIFRCFTESLNLNLNTCTVEDLESIYGVGPKTARFFLLHTRPNQNLAVLDTHILRWMQTWISAYIPGATPSGKKYKEVEDMFLTYCTKHNMTPSELDLQIWSESNKGE